MVTKSYCLGYGGYAAELAEQIHDDTCLAVLPVGDGSFAATVAAVLKTICPRSRVFVSMESVREPHG